MTTRRRRATVVAVTLVSALLLAARPVGGAEPPDGGGLHVAGVDVTAYPEVRLEVTLPQSLSPDEARDAFTLTEDGRPRPVTATPLASRDVSVVLLVDTSGSMAGAAIDAARQAAAAFLDVLPAGAEVGVVGFGDTAAVLAPVGTDRGPTRDAVAGLAARGETALYDGVELALAQLPSTGPTARRTIVLLSDGGDTVSASTLPAAHAAVGAAGVQLYAVALQTAESDAEALARLAEAGAGRVVPVEDVDGLSEVYRRIAAEVINRVHLTYRSEATGRTPLEVTLTRVGPPLVGRWEIQLPAPAVAPPERSAPAPAPFVPERVVFTDQLAVAGAAATFAGLLGLAYVLVAVREPRRRLLLDGGPSVAGRAGRLAGLAGRASAIAERGLERRGRRRSLDDALERAGVDLRAGEYLVLVGCVSVAAFALGLALGGVPVAVLLGVSAVLAGAAVLRVLTTRRQSRFGDQLGDVLQLLASSLRAGYGLSQAIQAVAREAERPACDEFGRVVVEDRLGRDPVAALRALGDRVQSEDFTWVVQAIEIHREVGGDLAEVLDTVAGTIRQRNQIRRQVKALSAEGRYSAYVLLALPFVVATLIHLSNPGYLAELTRSGAGLVMLAVAVSLMTAGALWLRKLTRLVF